MILYNVTIIIDENIQHEWLNWMRETHIPDVMATNLFVSNRILKVLDSPNEGVTYCIQYIADSIEKYNEYKEKFSQKLQLDISQKFESKLASFRTVMEFID